MIVWKRRHGGGRVFHRIKLPEEERPPLLQLEAGRVDRQPFTMEQAPATGAFGLHAAVVG